MNDLLNIRIVFIICLLGIFPLKGNAKAKDSIAVFERMDYWEECDICGCSGNGGSMGYGTLLNNNFVGMRYINQHYRSLDGIYNNSPWIDENFNTLQAWSQIRVSEKITVNAILPYHFHNRQFENGKTQNISGLGDINILAFYKLISPKMDGWLPEQEILFKHNLSLGGGIKAPTGEYNRANNEGSVNPGFQVGTGSWDYILATDYSVTYKTWGAGALLNYTFKTENDDAYQFGNQLNYGVNIYKNIATNAMWGVTPAVGVSGEVFEENRNYGQAVRDTKGNILFGRLGLETSYNRISMGINLMLPISQNLNAGNVEAVQRLGIHLNYNLY